MNSSYVPLYSYSSLGYMMHLRPPITLAFVSRKGRDLALGLEGTKNIVRPK